MFLNKLYIYIDINDIFENKFILKIYLNFILFYFNNFYLYIWILIPQKNIYI